MSELPHPDSASPQGMLATHSLDGSPGGVSGGVLLAERLGSAFQSLVPADPRPREEPGEVVTGPASLATLVLFADALDGTGGHILLKALRTSTWMLPPGGGGLVDGLLTGGHVETTVEAGRCRR